MKDFQRQGWVRFYRKSIDSTVWKNQTIWWVWSWCLLKANHQQKEFPFNGSDIVLNKGDFITGIKIACAELKLTPQKYRTAINYLKKTKRITTKSTNQFTLISVLKWQEYQGDNKQNNKPITNQQQTDNKRITTNKNDKKEKNDKNIADKSAKPFSFSSLLKEMKDNKNNLIPIIALYWEYNRKLSSPENYDQYKSKLSRELRPAKSLKGYDLDRIKEVMIWLNGTKIDWVLSTVNKYIDKDLVKITKENTGDFYN